MKPLINLGHVAHILGITRQRIPEFWRRPHPTSKLDERRQKLSTLQILGMVQERQKARSSKASASDHQNDKAQQSDECSEPQYEYLSLGLPSSPTDPVAIFGWSDRADLEFVKRSVHALTILRVLSQRSGCSIPPSGQALVDSLLKEVADLVCGIASHQEKRCTCPTCLQQK